MSQNDWFQIAIVCLEWEDDDDDDCGDNNDDGEDDEMMMIAMMMMMMMMMMMRMMMIRTTRTVVVVVLVVMGWWWWWWWWWCPGSDVVARPSLLTKSKDISWKGIGYGVPGYVKSLLQVGHRWSAGTEVREVALDLWSWVSAILLFVGSGTFVGVAPPMQWQFLEAMWSNVLSRRTS